MIPVDISIDLYRNGKDTGESELRSIVMQYLPRTGDVIFINDEEPVEARVFRIIHSYDRITVQACVDMDKSHMADLTTEQFLEHIGLGLDKWPSRGDQ